MLVMSPERPPSSDGGPILESPNMVLSSIPIESGHVLQQQQQIPQQYHQHQNINHAITNGSYAYAPSSTTSSKLLVLQPNQLNDSYITTNDSNAVGNIVLLATEQMEIGSLEHNGVHSNNTTDEELTSLTWLHDKNLLKVNNLGINLTCTNGNAVKTLDENSPPHRKNSGAISPTSDFLDDSCVSEDNASSANSLSDQGISIYGNETIPTSYQFVNNNNSINKNRNQIPSTTQVIQLGASGTVIEYMTSNLPGKLSTALQQTSNAPTVITSTSTTATVTPAHQHFHKKYLREEHNKTLKEMTVVNISSSPVKLELNGSSNYDTTSSIISEKDYQGTPMRQPLNRTEPSSPDSYSPSSQTQNQKISPHKLKHPTNMPYDPLIHTNNKPPLSFSSLIFLAIEDSIEKALPVKEIYAWIVAHYPYFKTAPTGWKNSVRHNLSLNKCFQKVEKAPNMGKGSLWRVEQQYKQNLIQALTRSSYHPCTNSLEKGPFKASPRPAESPPGFKPGARPLDADLFPRLSKFMAEMVSNEDTPSPPGTPIEDDYHQQIFNNNNNNNSSSNKNIILSVATSGHIVYNNERIARDWGADSIDDVNAATAMLALKHGPKVFNESFRNGHPPVITSSPSEDHTYSAGGLGGKRSSNNNSDNNSNGTSSDAAYESSEESHTNNILTKEELEARHHAEGVDAFLTFATEVSSMSSPIKRPPSPDSCNGSYVEHISNGCYEPPVIHHNHNNHFTYISSPPPPKKSRSRTLRTKLKKKPWLR